MVDFTKLETLTKTALQDELHALSAVYPALTSISANELTKKEMLERAQEIVAAADAAPAVELDDDAKRAAVQKVIETRPNAVVIPTNQGVFQLEHPVQARERFTISVYPLDDASTVTVSPQELSRRWHEPGKPTLRPRTNQTLPAGVALKDIPAWAHILVFDYLQSQELEVFEDTETLQKEYQNRLAGGTTKRGSLLDHEVAEPRLRIARANVGLREESSPIVTETVTNFQRPEQEAAWNVLNAIIKNETPLPLPEDELSTDPRSITSAEVMHVRDRIKRCIDDPTPWCSRKIDAKAFDLRVFFNQLLETEYSGYSPRRPGSLNRTGGTRPAILNVIRIAAEAQGFDTIGDYVSRKADTDIRQDLIPTIPLVNREGVV